MKNLKIRLERLEQEHVRVADEPLVILYTVLSADGVKPKQLEPIELHSSYGGPRIVAERRSNESLDELIKRVQREYPDIPCWTGFYTPLEDDSTREEAVPNQVHLSSP